MKIIEADGSSKERELTIKRKFSNNKNQTFVKILKPTDQRGAGFLSVVENGSEQQWIFLPSSKQVRRFVSKNKQEGVLGSELSPQDLDLTTVKSAEAKLLKIEKVGKTDVATIEVVSKSNATAYSKAQLWINLSNHTPIRIEYYDAQGQALKRVEFLNYTTVNKIQRAQKVVIKNLKNKRGTELLLSEINANSGLSDDAFTQRALSKD
jgi:outer membrane lipoprotein-sorting protein